MTPTERRARASQSAEPDSDGSDGDRGRSTRRRGVQLEDAILEAAWAVLVADGYSGFSYDAIARRAETSRAVLYRRWPQRHLMLETTLRRFWTPIEIPDTGSLRGDGIALLRSINDSRADLMTVFTQQLADYYRETGNTADQLRQIIGAEREGSFETLVTRAVRRGELAAEPSTRRIVNLPLDLLRGDMVMRSGRDPEQAVTEIIDDIWLPLLRG